MGTRGLIAKLHSAVYILSKSIFASLYTLLDFTFTYCRGKFKKIDCLHSYISTFLNNVQHNDTISCLGFREWVLQRMIGFINTFIHNFS